MMTNPLLLAALSGVALNSFFVYHLCRELSTKAECGRSTTSLRVALTGLASFAAFFTLVIAVALLATSRPEPPLPEAAECVKDNPND